MKATFPDMVFDEDDEEEGVTTDIEETFYLWDVNKELFELYKILRNYLSEYYSADSAILLALIKDHNLPVTETLTTIPYIHSGYTDILLTKFKIENKEDGREDT